MNYEELVGNILERVGTRENVTSVTNCMTRLRIKVKDDQKIDAEALKQVKGVLGIVQDRKNYIEASAVKCAERWASRPRMWTRPAKPAARAPRARPDKDPQAKADRKPAARPARMQREASPATGARIKRL